MFGRDSTDRKEHLNDPYPGLSRTRPCCIRSSTSTRACRWSATGSWSTARRTRRASSHCHHRFALDDATGMINRGRYGRLGKYLAEVEVYDADGNPLGRDKQVRTRVAGQKTVQWQSIAGRGARAERTAVKIRAMAARFEPASDPARAAFWPARAARPIAAASRRPG